MSYAKQITRRYDCITDRNFFVVLTRLPHKMTLVTYFRGLESSNYYSSCQLLSKFNIFSFVLGMSVREGVTTSLCVWTQRFEKTEKCFSGLLVW